MASHNDLRIVPHPASGSFAHPSANRRLSVLQLCDSLDAGGLERVAVNVANGLPEDRFESSLCATRRGGALENLLEPHVRRVKVERRSRYDVGSIRRLARHLRERPIDVLHAHGTALFFAAAAASLAPRVALVWHDHFGRFRTEARPAWLYRLATRRVQGVIGVSRPLVDWAVQSLGVRQDRAWYLPNFVRETARPAGRVPLDGTDGFRIVCLANVRPEKDHGNLIRAMAVVAKRAPAAHLILVGDAKDTAYEASLRALAARLGLNARVSWLGARNDAAAILASCDVGVLASASEGLPLALLEYGAAGLPAAATDVGECGEVLAKGRAGLVVPPGDPEALADALLSLLGSPGERSRLASALRDRCERVYGPAEGIAQVVRVYETLRGASA